jgi:hypothetical protein
MVRMTAALPDDKESVSVRARMGAYLTETGAGPMTMERIDEILDEMGRVKALTNTVGTKDQPGAVRLSIKRSNDLAALVRQVVAYWDENQIVQGKKTDADGQTVVSSPNVQISSRGSGGRRGYSSSDEKSAWDIINGQD